MKFKTLSLLEDKKCCSQESKEKYKDLRVGILINQIPKSLTFKKNTTTKKKLAILAYNTEN